MPLTPLPEHQWDEAVDAALSRMLPAERRNPRAAGNALATMVRHPALTKAFLQGMRAHHQLRVRVTVEHGPGTEVAEQVLEPVGVPQPQQGPFVTERTGGHRPALVGRTDQVRGGHPLAMDAAIRRRGSSAARHSAAK